MLCSSIIAGAQSFTLMYPFTGASTTSGLIDPTPTPTAVGVTSGSFTAVGTPSLNPNAGGRFSFVGWPSGMGLNGNDTYSTMTGSINTSEYYEIALTPQSGYTLSLNTLTFKVQRSGTGIRNYAVRTSADGFTNNLPASITPANSNLSVVGTNEFFWNLDATTSAQNGSTINFLGASTTSSVSFRFYAWNSESSGGTFSIDTVIFNGSVASGTVACNSPTISAITGNSVICSNQSLHLGSTVQGTAPFTYTWTGSGALSSVNSSTTSVTGATSSNYVLSVSNACGTASAAITATVNTAPVLSVNSASVCSGSSATLVASGANTYSYSSGNSVVTPTATTNYTVIGTNTVTGCSATAITTITVISNPVIIVNSGGVCTGESYTITPSGASTYTYSSGSAIVTPTASTSTYTVTGTNSFGCVGSAVATVSVSSTLLFNVNSGAICLGNSFTITPSGASTYTYSSGSAVVTPTANTTYTVLATNSAGCSGYAISSVTVNALPTVSVNSAAICIGATASLTASGASIYLWNTAQTTSSISVTPTASVQYTVVGTNSNNCSNSAVATVTVNALPVVSLNLSAINLQCVNVNSVSLSGGLPAGGTYTGTAVTLGNFSPSSAGVGTYTITYSYTDANNCSNTADDVMTVDACTGINTIESSSFIVYPNPSNGIVTVKSMVYPASINVFDLSGKLVASKVVTTTEMELNLSELANGVYHLSIITDKTTINHKIMINK